MQRKVHHRLLESILQRRLQYFNMTPQSEILGVFVRDISVIDEDFPRNFSTTISESTRVIGQAALNVFSLGYWVLISFLTVILAVHLWMKKYLTIAVKLRKLNLQESNKMSGVLLNLIEGIEVVRCARAPSEADSDRILGKASEGERLMKAKFEEAVGRTNRTSVYENFARM